MNEAIDNLILDFIANSAEAGDLTHITEVMSVGVVVDNDDPLQQGRLRIFCPSYNDDPKKLLHLPWAGYVSPVGGVINNQSYTRGHIPRSETTIGPVHYGFWAIPEVGAHAIIACINGDPRRRIWLGCLPSHQETHTLGHGRFKHIDSEVQGPQSSTGGFIEPTATQLREAFGYQMGSAEWRTRAADYQITSVKGAPASNKQEYIDSDNASMKTAEPDSWVDQKLGDHGYDWTGFKNLASFLASRVFSWSTPGFHSIQMDDRPFNSRIRIRTTGGSQIILDDTNERMYFSVSGGKSWIEMDASGNIDMFAERRLSIHSGKDINFSADESIRLKAGTYISMYAGEMGGQTPLDSVPNTGEIRFHSANDMHMFVGNNLNGDIVGATNIVFGSGETSGPTNLEFQDPLEIKVASTMSVEVDDALQVQADGVDIVSANDVSFTVSGKNTSINTLIEFQDDYVGTFNTHTHPITSGSSAGNTAIPTSQTEIAATEDVEVIIEPLEDPAKFAPWTNRVPDHEPWPRVLMQDSDDSVNTSNSGHLNNVDWIKQYNNQGQRGREPIGKIEGTDTITRGPFWRR